MKCSFDELFYYHRKHKAEQKTERIKLLGIDAEALNTGEPFMFCLSDGTVIQASDLYETLFERKYRGFKFVCFNLKYDEGAIVYPLPNEQLNELRTVGRTEWQGYGFRSIPNKELVISKGHKSVAFYDIAQFYGTSLDKAAQYYLGKSKLDIETKTFYPDYVKRNFNKIATYCINDAKLTLELAEYFVDILIKELDIYPQKLYSTGYIAGIHFSRVCDIIDVRRYWRFHKNLLRYAYEAYAGGKFEVYQRGFGNFYQYDINSAYPYELAQLKDVRHAKVKHSKEYQKADYAFIRAKLTITRDYSPVPVNQNGFCYYPAGIFYKTITLAEYDFLVKRGDKIEIIDGYWLKCPDKKPYYDEVMRLYALKAKYKVGGDKLRYLLVKILLNSFYGKLIQVTYKHKGKRSYYEAGYLFNPIYAAVITANTRLRCSQVADNHKDEVVAIHTDSVITTTDLSTNGIKLSGDIGDWDLVSSGDGVMVGCGVYQVGDYSHYRGYNWDAKALGDLTTFIMSNKGKRKLTIEQQMVLSWRLVAFRNTDHNKINRFIKAGNPDSTKELNLHFDNKREWYRAWNWRRSLVRSRPLLFAAPKPKGY